MNIIETVKDKFTNINEEWNKGPIEKTSIILGLSIFIIGLILLIISALSIGGINIPWEYFISLLHKLPQGMQIQIYTLTLSIFIVVSSGLLGLQKII